MTTMKENDPAAAVLTKPAQSKVLFIPFDPDSPSHAERMYHQRIACGWKSEQVGKWVKLQKEGKMCLHWIILDPSSPDAVGKLQQHTSKYPAEALPLTDTAISLYNESREPSHASFTPIGHVSLDPINPWAPPHLDCPSSLYWIISLYVSRAIQSSGLGRATMDLLEDVARKEPWNAKILALDTMDPHMEGLDEMYKQHGLEKPKWSGIRGGGMSFERG